MQEKFDCGGKVLDLSAPRVMGILNVTPDSFSDGGRYHRVDNALQHARKMVEQGAHIIDVGGESTRPGAQAVNTQEELDRVIPVIEAIQGELDTIISIDTSKADVMKEAHKAGAGMINDVCALQAENALETAFQTGLPICIMHMQGKPRTMQHNPQYQDVNQEVITFLQARMAACLEQGISKEKLIIDPGFGFGKTDEHNLQLLANLSDLTSLDVPVLIGISRKSLLQGITDKTVEDRLAGSIALAVIAAVNGGTIFRVHDVSETIDALKVVNAVTRVHAKAVNAK